MFPRHLHNQALCLLVCALRFGGFDPSNLFAMSFRHQPVASNRFRGLPGSQGLQQAVLDCSGDIAEKAGEEWRVLSAVR
jgi:hypothetical protein